jgi:NAD(P)-dependent dehydrogenase (short-subunit alcohol dehydrogenase family)
MTSPTPRTAVVTGAASGIGAAIAERLVRDGWSVIGIDRTEMQDMAGVRFEAVDLADAEAIKAACDRIGKVDALVHAAGFMRTGAIEELDPADGDLMYAVHVRALALLVQNLTPGMAAGARIVAIGSRTSRGAKGKAQYAAAKAALTGLVRSFAIELAPRGITANIVSPAATATPFLTRSDRAGVPPIVPPIGRYIEPAEVAGAVSFLLGPDAGAVTGQDILICGGASL